MLLNKRLNRGNDGGNVRRTTDVFQVATSVLFQSPVQAFAITPNNLTDAPSFLMDFMKEVPTTWEETRFVDGYPGKYSLLARKSGERWYVAGVNAQEEVCTIKVRLPMLEGKSFILYHDNEDRQAQLEQAYLQPGEGLEIQLQPGGGILIVTSDVH